MSQFGSSQVPLNLLLANELAYQPAGLLCSSFEKEEESAEYEAFSFVMNNRFIKFRSAKITPKKVGQFVTLWKRQSGVTAPFDISDPIDFFVVSVRDGNKFGQFVFPKKILFEKGVLSKNSKGGKRAIRVYPPWSIAINKQAKATQKWQLDYFLDLGSKVDCSQVLDLFSSQ